MEQFSNGAIWGRHPMPYFKIPRTEKYGMRCARTLRVTSQIPDIGMMAMIKMMMNLLVMAMMVIVMTLMIVLVMVMIMVKMMRIVYR